MPRNTPIPSIDPREVLVLLEGLPGGNSPDGYAQPLDFEIAYGGQYLLMVRGLNGGGFGSGGSIQFQAYAGPEEENPPMTAGEWLNGPAAVTAPMAAPVQLAIGARSKVRVVATGAFTGNGLYVTLKRLPA